MLPESAGKLNTGPHGVLKRLCGESRASTHPVVSFPWTVQWLLSTVAAQYSGCRASRSPAQVACNGNCCSFHQQVSRWVIRMWVPDGYNQAIPLSVEKFVLSGKHDYHKYFFYPHFLGTKPAPGSVCRVKPQRRAGQLCHSALLPAKIHFIFQNPAPASRALGKHRCFNPLPHVVEQEPQGLQPSHCCAS